MANLADLLFDRYAHTFTANPYRVYDLLRRAAPVWRVPPGRWIFRHFDWVLTRYDDCDLALRDRRFGANDPAEFMRRFGPAGLEEPAVLEFAQIMAMLNPPDHTRLRGLVVRAFTSRQIEGLRVRVQGLADRLLDKVAAGHRMDVIKDLALPLTIFSICQLLGIPDEDRERFAAEAMNGAALMEPTKPTRKDLDSANAATLKGRAYFEGLFEVRRRCPQDDLITQLVRAREGADRLTTEELLANVRFLFIAGHETTVNLIGNGLLTLLRHPKQWQILRDDPSLIPNAIEEMLRYDAPVQAIPRVVLEPVLINGVMMQPREVVAVVLGAANRDGSVFKNADRLDVTRKNVKSLSFGAGIHFCLGAQLARLEAGIVFETLLRRLPNLHLAMAGHPNWRPRVFLRGLKELPVAWTPGGMAAAASSDGRRPGWERPPLQQAVVGGCLSKQA